MRDLTDSTIGSYDIVGLLGKGGMATVYRARQESMGRDVAIKVVPRESGETEGMLLSRFEQEARMIAQLQHPRILPVYDYGQTEEFIYLVMRLVEGGTLADLLAGKALDLGEVTLIAEQLASALDYAHERGIVHRDLKPSNVFLDAQGNVYLADFGIAKFLGAEGTQLTGTGFLVGTPAYMSPEQATGQDVDHRTDVYALGLILFEMLTGEQAFSGDSSVSIILKHLNEPPPLPSTLAAHLTPQVDLALTKALAKLPDDRHQTAGELADALMAAVQPLPQSVVMDGASKRVARDPARSEVTTAPSLPLVAPSSKRLLIGGGILAVSVVAVLGVLVVAVVGFLAFGGRFTGIGTGRAVTEQTPAAGETIAEPTPSATPGPRPTQEPTGERVPQETPGETPNPQVSPTLTVPTATPEPATPPLTVTAESGPQRVGRVRFLSVLSRLDTVNLQLVGIGAAPAGKHYEGWLIGDSGSALSIGVFAPDGNGTVDFTFTDPEGRNLAAVYAGFRSSLEPDFGDSPEMSHEIVLEGAVSNAAFPAVREAVSRSPGAPSRSLVAGLQTETALGLDHMTFARDALAKDDFAAGLNHAEHVLNILVGADDDRFGDKNADGQTQNPGDGYGVIGYLNTLLAKAAAAERADPASEELALHVGFLEVVVENSLQRVDGIVQLVERCFLQDSAASALTLIDQAVTLHDEMMNGLDANSNGAVEPIKDEGGILLVVEHTGYLANIEVYQARD